MLSKLWMGFSCRLFIFVNCCVCVCVLYMYLCINKCNTTPPLALRGVPGVQRNHRSSYISSHIEWDFGRLNIFFRMFDLLKDYLFISELFSLHTYIYIDFEFIYSPYPLSALSVNGARASTPQFSFEFLCCSSRRGCSSVSYQQERQEMKSMLNEETTREKRGPSRAVISHRGV